LARTAGGESAKSVKTLDAETRELVAQALLEDLGAGDVC
jgi:hypothetical protein